jgi:hypothetical protein
MTRQLVLVMALVACGKVDNPDKVDAPGGGGSDAPPAVCPAGTTAVCTGDQLTTCDAQGQAIKTETCAVGCNASQPRCNKLEPSNNLAMFLDEAASAPDLVLTGAATINTDTGAITDGAGAHTPPTSTVSVGIPVPILVIKVKSLVVSAVTVSGARALAIVSAGDITVNGRISVNAQRDVAGPGALVADAACRGKDGANGTDGDPGGGGGGFGTAGAQGGNGGVPTLQGGLGGSASGNIELVPLRGGCSGGLPGGGVIDVDPVRSDPGGGGGAIQIVSGTKLTLGPGASISANGAGGKANNNVLLCLVDTPCGDGEGGGSGGGILLEAPAIEVDASGGVFANGGGGLCQLSSDAPAGPNAATPAAPQTCGGDTGNGGAGAAGLTAATRGGNGLNDDPVGGGGGGGVGRIRINLPLGKTFTPAGVISPPHTAGTLAVR